MIKGIDAYQANDNKFSNPATSRAPTINVAELPTVAAARGWKPQDTASSDDDVVLSQQLSQQQRLQTDGAATETADASLDEETEQANEHWHKGVYTPEAAKPFRGAGTDEYAAELAKDRAALQAKEEEHARAIERWAGVSAANDLGTSPPMAYSRIPGSEMFAREIERDQRELAFKEKVVPVRAWEFLSGSAFH